MDQAKQEISRLHERALRGEIELFAFDEARFTTQPSVPYAWQAIEERIELPSHRGGGVSTLAFVSTSGEVRSYSCENTVDSQLVIDVMNDFRRHRNQETWVVLDNASPHTSRRFRAQEDGWNEQGLQFYFLPPRSPQLNWVERLWARIRYQWLPLDATESLSRLQGCVDDILAKLGQEYHYHPAIPSTS